jgi:hypothetical protein
MKPTRLAMLCSVVLSLTVFAEVPPSDPSAFTRELVGPVWVADFGENTFTVTQWQGNGTNEIVHHDAANKRFVVQKGKVFYPVWWELSGGELKISAFGRLRSKSVEAALATDKGSAKQWLRMKKK